MEDKGSEGLWPLSKRVVHTLNYGQRANIGGDIVIVDIGEASVRYMRALGGESPTDLLDEFKRRGLGQKRERKKRLTKQAQ